MSKVHYPVPAADKTSSRLVDGRLDNNRSFARGATNKRCIANIRQYWQDQGYTVSVDIIYDGGIAVIRSDMMDGLPLVLWAKRGGVI